MAKVFFDVGVTLDGVMAPEERPDDPQGTAWNQDWNRIIGWVFSQKSFRENLKLGEGGETGADNDWLAKPVARAGASVMGKRMFFYGEKGWPEEAPFHTPVFVLTHEKREPWRRPGGTTFYFVDGPLPAVVERAKDAARGKDVRIAGGVTTVRQFLNAGLIDDFTVHVSAAVLGRGGRLFDGVDLSPRSLDLIESATTAAAAHLRYRVRTRPSSR